MMQPLEAEIIGRIQKSASAVAQGDLRVGVGDDTAVFKVRADEESLLSTDQVIEKTHFLRDRHPPEAIGHLTLARGLSDIAAMGGMARCFLLSLCLPDWALGEWLTSYIRGVVRLMRKIEVPLAGGDVARGEKFSAAVTVVGSCPRGRALLRSGALPGDALYVSGSLGGSALGLERLRKGGVSARDRAVRRHLFPEPRLALGRYLRTRLRGNAAIDLSDGLSMDLSRLTEAGSVGAEILAANIPIFPGASLSQALHGGEDYELLFSVSAGKKVPREYQGVALTRIGTIRRKPGIILKSQGGEQALEPEGFQHFGAKR